MMNIEEAFTNNQKKKKLHIILTVAFSFLLVLSIVLFIVFSNYKIEVLMDVIGSIVASIFTIILLSEIFGWLLPNLYMGQYLKELKMAKEVKVYGKVDNVYKDLVTIRKGILFIKIDINNTTYYCSDPEIVSEFSVSESKTFIIRDTFIVGVEDEK